MINLRELPITELACLLLWAQAFNLPRIELEVTEEFERRKEVEINNQLPD